MSELSSPQEHTWLSRIAGGDEGAFTELVKKYDSLVFTFINNIVQDPESAEEMVNDIFIQVWLGRESLAAIKNIHTYLFVISRNYALNGMRNKIRGKRRLQSLPDLITDAGLSERDHLALNLIDEAVENLPTQRQKIWMLNKREGKSYDEIGQSLNITRNTVKTQLRSANQSIAEYVIKRMELPVIIWLLLR